jgi:hypothetical protein
MNSLVMLDGSTKLHLLLLQVDEAHGTGLTKVWESLLSIIKKIGNGMS